MGEPIKICDSQGSYSNSNNWAPNDFKLEISSVWSFPNRGSWATHNGKYRGNWSPYIPRNLILRYSKKNDVVLDPFLGGGTTLIECKLLKRKGIGIDINQSSINIAKNNITFKYNGEFEPNIYCADARKMSFLNNESIDLICAHPPYANVIKYSEFIDGDISLHDDASFLEEIQKVAKECYRVLKKNKYCAILMGDIRKKGYIIPLGNKVMSEFMEVGFELKEIVLRSNTIAKELVIGMKKVYSIIFYL